MQSMAQTHDGDQEQPAKEPWSEVQICGVCVNRGDGVHSGGDAGSGAVIKCGGCDFDCIACFVAPYNIHEQAD